MVERGSRAITLHPNPVWFSFHLYILHNSVLFKILAAMVVTRLYGQLSSAPAIQRLFFDTTGWGFPHNIRPLYLPCWVFPNFSLGYYEVYKDFHYMGKLLGEAEAVLMSATGGWTTEIWSCAYKLRTAGFTVLSSWSSRSLTCALSLWGLRLTCQAAATKMLGW